MHSVGWRYGGLVSLVFRAEDQTSRVDYWQQVVADMLCPLAVRAGAVPDRLVVGDLGPVRVGELTAMRPGGAERTPTLIRRSDPDLCKIDVQVAGHVVIEQDGRVSRQAPGDCTFVDLSRPCRWTNASAKVVAVIFPRDALGLRSDDLARLAGTHVPSDRGAGALVSALARELPRRIDDCRSAERARLGTAMLDLVSAALAARLGRSDDVPPESRRRALVLRVQAFIEQQLGDPALSPPAIAAAQYISVRYLHKLFETQQTTVADWIRRRRLERCRRDLLDPALRLEPVSAIAARWGLPSAAHFSRLFRAAYGLPPGEFRRRHLAW